MSDFSPDTCVRATRKYFENPHSSPNTEGDISGSIGFVVSNDSLYIKARFGDQVYLFEPDELEVVDGPILSPGFRH